MELVIPKRKVRPTENYLPLALEDHLNLAARGFIDLRVGENAMLINEQKGLAVEEVAGLAAESAHDAGHA